MEHFTPADGYERRAYARAVQIAREALRAGKGEEWAHSGASEFLRRCAIFDRAAVDGATADALSLEA